MGPLWAGAAPRRTCLEGGIGVSARPPSERWALMELSRVLDCLALKPSALSPLPAFAEMMALDFIHFSRPPGVQNPPPMCPPACPTSFPNVPVLSLSVTKPHSVRNLLFFPHFKYRIKEQKIWSWFLPARREKNETEAQDSNVPKDWEHSNFPFSIPFSPTSAPTLPEGSTLHPSTYHGKLGMRSPHRLSWQCLWHILGRQTHLQAPEKEGGSYWGKLFLGGNTDIWHTFSMLSFLMCLLMPSIPPLLPYSKYTRPCHPNNNRVRVAWGP